MATDPFIGEIMMVPFDFAPKGWVLCNGQILSISEHGALFALIGSQYGGDGRSTFAVPDLRGRVPIGAGQGRGLQQYRELSYQYGNETIALTNNQLPTHTHTATFHPTYDDGSSESENGTVTGTLKVTEAEADSITPGSDCVLGTVQSTTKKVNPPNIYSTTGTADKQLRNGSVTGTSSGGGGGITGGEVVVDDQGQGLRFGLLQPSLTINFCIATDGLFPPRN